MSSELRYSFSFYVDNAGEKGEGDATYQSDEFFGLVFFSVLFYQIFHRQI